MNLKKLFPVVILFSAIAYTTTSCNFTYQNSEEDKQDAEKVTMLLYAFLESKDYQKTFPFFSKKFYEITDSTNLKKIYTSCDEKLGEIKNKELLKWETRVVKGANSVSEYVLQYDVTRTKYHSTETIRLLKENDSIRIVGYHVNSPGLLE